MSGNQHEISDAMMSDLFDAVVRNDKEETARILTAVMDGRHAREMAEQIMFYLRGDQ